MPTLQTLLTGRPVLTVSSQATVLEAAKVMHENRIGCVLVAEADDAPVGIFTERDLMVRVVVAGKDVEQTRIREVMTAEVFTAGPESSVCDMRRELQQRHIRHLPVVQDGKAVGMLSLRDLLRADLHDHRHQVEALTEYIHGPDVDSAAE